MSKIIHGFRKRSLKRTKEYDAWQHMIQRCTNPKNHIYYNYGGRGIGVCERWLKFSNFIADVGLAPSKDHSLDRYPNNNGNYEPGNVRWATDAEQQSNRTNNVYIEYDGLNQTLSQWSRMRRIAKTTLSKRLKRGLSIEQALSKEKFPKGRKKKS